MVSGRHLAGRNSAARCAAGVAGEEIKELAVYFAAFQICPVLSRKAGKSSLNT